MRHLFKPMLAMLVLMPMMAVVLVRTFDFPHAMEVALVALAISPVPPLLPNRENKAGGAAPYGLGLMATAGALSIVVVPVAVAFLQRVFDRPLGVARCAEPSNTSSPPSQVCCTRPHSSRSR